MHHHHEAVAMTPMPAYRSHKTVYALKIRTVTRQFASTDPECIGDPIRYLVGFENEDYAPLMFTPDELLRKPLPREGWYYVQYEDGYFSFSPAEQFEEGYTAIKPPVPEAFKERVHTEKAELDEKIEKLTQFRTGSIWPKLPIGEQERLSRQLSFMTGYSEVLAERIANF